MNYLILDSIAALFLIATALYIAGWRRRRSLPPGPPPPPIIGTVIGNVLDMPTTRAWLTYTDWKKQYGNIIHIRAFNQDLIILNGLNEAVDLLHGRGAMYSDRMQKTMMHELMGMGWGVTPLPYGQDWRIERRLLHEQFHQHAVAQYAAQQEACTVDLVARVHAEPAGFAEHIDHWAAAIVVAIGYGIDLNEDHENWFVQQANHSNRFFSLGMLPFKWIVDSVPILKYVPEWVPGVRFHQVAKEARSTWVPLLDIPFDRVKAEMAKQTAPHSYVANLLSDMESLEESSGHSSAKMEWHIKSTAGGLYSAGAETTSATLYTAVAVMCLFPKAKAKAQAELDAALGPNYSSMPSLAMRPDLPYTQAFVKEVQRLYPMVPLGIPHSFSSTSDDLYEGYRIPNGSLVIANAWAILHDEKVYPSPWEFRPERFLQTEKHEPEPDPSLAGVFGFGRRICPGSHLAEASVWIGIASLLRAFDVSATLEEQAHIRSAMVGVDHIVARPLPYTCSIKPRIRA